ncbi:MAG TPA: protein kinase [Roseiflexaceae bacterium]|nr:protein kinase [Roseiflexaceae bacterium]
MSDLVGRTLGPYRLLEQLGVGGMATVYRAYQPAMDRYVAVKVLPQHLGRDPNFRARFQREARTIARLEHRYILPVHDAGEEGGIAYLVMRHTDGGTLSDLIAAGTLAIERAVTLVAQVAEALAYAHRQGVIHRDVKPANVLISREGDALLSDFGIAKIFEETLHLTGEGAIVGTPFYMAPEQVQGQPADARTDLYSLGVVLYEALTGRRPFVAETPLAVALMHVHNPLPPPRQINPAIPEALERVILRALAKSPADRFQTGEELVEALRGAGPTTADRRPQTGDQGLGAPGPGLASPVAPPSALGPQSSPRVAPATVVLGRPPRWLWPAAGTAAILALLVAAALLVRSPSPATPALPTAPPATAFAGPLPAGPTITPRAGLLALTHTGGTRGLAVLGDTVWAATTGGLVRYTPDGTSRVFTIADGLPFNHAWSLVAAPDGTLWAGSGGGRVAHIRPVADGLGEVTLYTADEGMEVGDVTALMVDADGALWAGGAYGEASLSRFDGTRWQRPDLPLDDPALQDVFVAPWALLRSADGALWVGLYDRGILRWDGARWTHFTAEQGVGDTQVTRLVQTGDGTIWAAAGDRGLLRFDAAQDRWQRVAVLRDDAPVRWVAALGAELWAASDDFLARSDDGGATWRRAATDQDVGWGAGPLVQDTAGRVWFGNFEGRSVRDGNIWHRLGRQGELPDSQVATAALGPDGKIWAVPLYGGPVALVDPAGGQVETPPELALRVSAVASSPGVTWLGTGEGLVRLSNGATLRLTEQDGLPSNEIWALLVADETLWVGTRRGLVAYDLTAGAFGAAVPEFDGGLVSALVRAPDGAVWAGTHRDGDSTLIAVGRFDGSAWQVWREGEAPVLGADGVTAIGADLAGRVWVAGWSDGLHSWDGERWRRWAPEDGAPSGRIFALAARGDELWLGGEMGDRLFRWSVDGWRSVRVDGLAGVVHDILATEDGALWLATEDGLLRYQP